MTNFRKTVTRWFAAFLVGIIFLSSTPEKVKAANYSTFGSTLDLQIDLDKYENFGWTTYFLVNCYGNGYLKGSVNTLFGFGQLKSGYAGDFMDSIVCYNVVTPKKYKGTSNGGETLTYTGYAESLRTECSLGSGFNYISSYPENVSSSTSYTIGASKSDVNASTTITKNAIEITNKSDIDKDYFSIFYDYKPALLATSSRNDYLKNVSTQNSLCYYSTEKTSYTVSIKTTGKFGYMYGIFTYSDDCATNSRTVTVRLGNE